MSYFDTVQDNMKTATIVNKYKNFEQFYYNVKKIMNSAEFKRTGSGFVSNTALNGYSFHRKIYFKKYTVYVDSGLLCTTISLQQEYYRGIQCSAIVTRSNSDKSTSSNSHKRHSPYKTSSTYKDDSSSDPLNPSNPTSW